MSNRLPILAAEIGRAHADVQETTRTAAERAIVAGHALIEAKALCPHGRWLPFLAETHIPERSAQRYMVLAASKLQSDTVSLLGGINSAIRFIRLREQAMRHFDLAEALAREFDETGEGGERLTLPIECAMAVFEEMVGMFPPEVANRELTAVTLPLPIEQEARP